MKLVKRTTIFSETPCIRLKTIALNKSLQITNCKKSEEKFNVGSKVLNPRRKAI